MKWSSGYRIRLMLVGFIAAILLGSIELAMGATIAVGPGPDCDFDTIQAGIDVANDADIVLVTPGEYVITEPITFRGKAITVKSEAGPDETTIQMGTPADSNRGSVVVFENGETAASVLDGFTITGGIGSWLQDALYGGGICFNASSATVRNCAIEQNTARRAGGVACLYPCSPTLIECIIADNSSIRSGGGLSAYYGSSLTLTNCIVRGNSAGSSGGGVICADNSSMTITNCIIKGNSAEGTIGHTGGGGGVICWDNSSMTMTYCTIVENSAGRIGGGVYSGENSSSVTMTHCAVIGNTGARWGGGLACAWSRASMTIRNCTIWGNSATEGGGVGCFNGASATVTNIFLEQAPTEFSVAYSNVADGQAGVRVQGGSTLDWAEGNIDADPLFADPNNDDFHLKSEAGRWDPNSQVWLQDDITSPCIDAGDPMSPIGLEPFPNGGFINMGAYGGTPEASKSYFGEPTCGTIVAGDINGDCQVNRTDLEIMALHWTDENPLPLP